MKKTIRTAIVFGMFLGFAAPVLADETEELRARQRQADTESQMRRQQQENRQRLDTLERQQREQQNRLDAQRREANSNQYYRGSRSQGLFSR